MRRLRLAVDGGSQVLDVDVEIVGDPPVSALLDEVRALTGLALDPAELRGLGTLDPAWPVSECDLRDGDTLQVQQPASREPHARAMVVDGPDVGREVVLSAGTHVIGRDAAADLRLIDDSVSRRHAEISVGVGTATIRDLGSLNGVVVDGDLVSDRRDLDVGDELTLGDTTLRVEEVPTGSVATWPRPETDEGVVPFNRSPRSLRSLPERVIELPTPPETPRPARFPVAAAIVPILLGAIAFLVIREPATLLFLALGPLMVVFSVIDSRRSGRGDFARDSSAFRARIDSLHEDAESVGAEWSALADDRHPPVAELLRRVAGRSPRLWERELAHHDALDVRVGRADLPNGVTVRMPSGGDGALRAEAAARFAGVDQCCGTPLHIDLRELGSLGVVGVGGALESVVDAVVLRIATDHGPSQVEVWPAPGAASGKWAHWLPHVPHQLLRDDLEGFLARLSAEVGTRSGRNGQKDLPAIVAVMRSPSRSVAPIVQRILSEGPEVGVYGIVDSGERHRLPSSIGAIVDIGQREVVLPASGTVITGVDFDGVDRVTVRAAALALAPVRDLGDSDPTTSIPAVVHALGLGSSQLDVRSRWTRPFHGPATSIGVGANGPLRLDLSASGPHMVVAGTTGSGKSEFLQSLVAGMAMEASPSMLNFVLVDYKGGAAFRELTDLPHTVGFFTDLDDHLARRALTSLEAELKFRERRLAEVGAKDLDAMRAMGAEDAPPSLVIVFDEFAALRAEVPEFVAGVVDIAQRGRSLGVHLVLATQSPSGIVDDKIRANTNIWVALRTRGEQESYDILGTGVGLAAEIPTSARGRGYLRIGSDEPQLFQAAYVGGRRNLAPEADGVRVWRLGDDPPRTKSSDSSDATDLERIVEACCVGAPPGLVLRLPWLEPLDSVNVSDLPVPSSRDVAVIGLADRPERQAHEPLSFDLAADHHVLVIGNSGSGKTTFVRTLVAQMAATNTADEFWVYGLDFAGAGLRSLEVLPHCGAVVAGDDRERVDRLLAMFEGFVAERRAAIGAAGASSAAELRRSGGSMPLVLLAIDGYFGLEAFDDPLDHGATVDRLATLLNEGAATGVHIVLTATRRSGIATNVVAQAPTQLALRLAEPDEYGWMDLAEAAAGMAFRPGRGLLRGRGLELQVGVLGHDGSASSQAAALAELAKSCEAASHGPPPVRRLPERVSLAEIEAVDDPAVLAVGLSGRDLTVAGISADPGSILVVGPPRSGRSTTLATVAMAASRKLPTDVRFELLSLRAPSFGLDRPWSLESVGHEAVESRLRVLADGLSRSGEPSATATSVIVFDDADHLDEGLGAMALETLVRRVRDSGILLLLAAETFAAHRAFGGWLGTARKTAQGVLLAPDATVDGDIFNATLPRRSPLATVPGRGFVVTRGSIESVQIALPDDAERSS